jgi:uridine kinase
MEILQKHREIISQVRPLVVPWRRLTIGIDGADGAGKSTLARFLAWQLEMPVLETDMFLEKGRFYPYLKFDELSNLIDWRHSLNRPIIVEGIFLLETLECINVSLDVLIYVVNKDFEGSRQLQARLGMYKDKYKPNQFANFLFVTSDNDFVTQNSIT